MILAHREWGDPGGQPVVLVHGITSNALRYRRLAPQHLAHRRAVAVDLRGHGDSGVEPPWRTAAHVADLLETADALGIGRCDWVGHSFGGRLVHELAAAHPERVERLVLLDPALRSDPVRMLEWAEEIRLAEPAADLDLVAAEWRATVARAPDDVLVEAIRDSHEPTGDGRFRRRYAKQAIVAGVGELASEPPEPGAVPTLLLVAEDSDLVTQAQRAWLAETLGGLLSVVTVPGGHSVQLDALAETGAAVAEFLG